MTFPIPSAALDDRLAVVGTAGSGKTYLVLGAIEHLLARKSRIIGIDPLGVMWGLRLCADGHTPSPFQPVIFGGAHGDLPLNEHAGALVGETVATMRESCIIDLSSLGTKNAERRFMLAFLTALYRATDKEPVHLIIDEADMFAPQKLLDKEGDAAKLLGMMETVVRRGRVKGFIPWLITQRPAVLSKDVLSQADGLVALKLTASQDRKAIGAWVESTADAGQWRTIDSALPAFQRGEGVVWIPARGIIETVSFPARATFDSSRTPKRGEKRESRELKPLNIDALKGKLAAIADETKANDPKVLKAEIAKLKADIGKLSAAKPTNEMPKSYMADLAAAEARGYIEGRRAGFCEGHGIGFADGLMHAHTIAVLGAKTTADECKRTAESIRTAVYVPRTPPNAKSDVKYSKPIPTPVAQRKSASKPITAKAEPDGIQEAGRSNRPGGANGHDTSLTNPQRQLLGALAWWARMGHATPTRTQVAAIAGWKPKGSNLRNRLTELSTAGLVEYPAAGTVRLTAIGEEAAPEPDMGRGLHDSIRGILTNPQWQLFEVLLEESAMQRHDLAARVGWEINGSNLRNRLTELSSLELVEYPSRGEVALQDWVTA